MKTIRENIDIFVSVSGISRYSLAKEAGVNLVYLTRLKNGQQQDIFSSRADALRAAMRRLDPAAAEKALDDACEA
jgi:hypothetical protein